MLNLSDKDLDRLSREAAEQFTPEGVGPSWDKLSAILDKEIGTEPPVSVVRYRFSPLLLGALLLLLLAGGIGLWKLTGRHTPANISKQVASASSAGSSPGEHNAATQSKGSAGKQGGNESLIEQHPGAGAGAPPENTTGATSGSGSKQELSSPSNTLPGDRDTHKDAPSSADFSTHKSSKLIALGAGTSAASLAAAQASGKKNGKTPGQHDLMQNGGLANAGGESATEFSLKPATLPSLYLPYLGSHEIRTDDDALGHSQAGHIIAAAPAGNKGKPAQAGTRVNRALSIGLMAGPDYTMVKSTTDSKLSGNVGLTLGYEVFNRFSVNTGLIYTQKNYNSAGVDFHLNPNLYSSSGISPGEKIQYVNGRCSMFEIPLTIRYDFSTSPRNIFFVNGGISSYLMKEEKYNFYYTGAWSSRMWETGWITYKKPQNYFAAVADLSVGYERRISQSFSLQVEPFVKLPLKGVGVGGIQLSSYGLSFSVRFSPVLSRKKN